MERMVTQQGAVERSTGEMTGFFIQNTWLWQNMPSINSIICEAIKISIHHNFTKEDGCQLILSWSPLYRFFRNGKNTIIYSNHMPDLSTWNIHPTFLGLTQPLLVLTKKNPIHPHPVLFQLSLLISSSPFIHSYSHCLTPSMHVSHHCEQPTHLCLHCYSELPH